MKQLMIIDGSSLLYRAFFALPPLKNALGTPTNAVYGFLTMLLKLYEEVHPDYVAIAFDKGRVTFRTDMYAAYKGNRPDAPDDLRPQFSLIREVLAALGLRVIEQEGFEGDDIIGTLSKKFGSQELSVRIVTGDRDSLQLVDSYAHVLLTKKGISDMLEVTLENMEEVYGYGPDKVIDMKALMGDSSDNIPGVPGVGEKTALKLIHQFGDLDTLYQHIPEVSGAKLKEKLENNKDLAFLSRTLATIKTDMDLSIELETLKQNFHASEMRPVFERLGFHKLIDRTLEVMGSPEESAAAAVFGEDSLFAMAEAEAASIEIVDGSALTEAYYKDKDVSVYCLFTGSMPFPSLESVFLYNGSQVVKADGQGDREAIWSTLRGAKAIYTIQSKELLHAFGQERPADLALLHEGQVRVYDFSLMAYLLDPTRSNYGMLYLCERFGAPMIRSSGKDDEYASIVQAMYAMKDRVIADIQGANLWNLYLTVELPLVRTLACMEKRGIYIDPRKLDATNQRFTEEMKTLQADIYQLAGETFNINSPKQLGVILFENLGLPVIKKTKTGYSTNAEVLELLRSEHPIIEKILAYRTVAKLISTYLEGLKVLIDVKTQRIHTNFNQMVTATGRLSSSEPNLQNIPVRTEKGREIRGLFLPGKGYDYLVSADYSQIELRILAHLSEDPTLIDAFIHGADIHRHTAAEVLGKAPEEVTAEERSHAKAVNFGIIYGISDFGLSRDLGISRQAAKEYIDLYFSRYPKVKEYMDATIAQAHETEFVYTMFGRLRKLDDINNRNFNRRSFAERMAMNTPIQGSAADIIKLAMNRVEERLEAEGFQSRMLLQVHDELVLEVVADEENRVEALLREVMESVVSLKVPLVVDVHSAENWALVK